ncbi:YetF domain-containing protein [Clostridium lundense]|uniref:YetF domain-containing protein n=1 Tax=Clostridium lundense TaxID=319475 RepID=UPI00047FDEE9|nr:DUF421 domain-containing protein [Clostridium lundense]
MNEGLVVCVRGIISFFTLLIFTRILGKQQLGEITLFDYVLGITIGSFAASITVDLSSSAWDHWVGLLTWTILGLLMQLISLKSRKTFQYINDNPIIIIYDGMVNGDNLKKIKFTFNELLQQLRLKDIFDIDEVKFAIVENNGKLSVIKKKEFEHLMSNINSSLKNSESNGELIFNGLIIDDNMSKLNIDQQWLLTELNSRGFHSPIEVFYAFIDSSGKLEIYSYKDKIVCSKDIFE